MSDFDVNVNLGIEPLEEGILQSDEDRKEIVGYLQDEINDVLTNKERERLVRKWSLWRRLAEARSESEEKDYPWKGACLRWGNQTEILMEDGWKTLPSIEVGDRALSREPITGRMSYQRVEEVLRYPYDGDLVRLKNLYYDLMITPNHRFLLETRYTGRTNEYTAEEIARGVRGLGNNLLPLSGNWYGTENIGKFLGFDMDDFVALLGWYLSEGSYYASSPCISIAQSKEANPENCRQIEELLNRMGLPWKYTGGNAYLISGLTPEVKAYFVQFGHCTEKFIPRDILALSRRQLNILAEALIRGDGHSRWNGDKHYNFPKVSYYTTSKRLADDVQELFLKLGYSGSVTVRSPRLGGRIGERQIVGKNKTYTVCLRRVQMTRFKRGRCHTERIPYRGEVGCLSVPPYHTIYVRENGKALWTMNSNLTTPLTMTDTHGLYALLKATYAARKPFFTVESTTGEHEHSRVLEKALDATAESRNHLNLRQTNNTIFYDLVRLGTQFVKVPWVTEAYTFKRSTAAGSETVTKVRRNSPGIIPIRIEDFLTRPYWHDIQRAPWVGHYAHKFIYELRQQAQQGIYDGEAVEKVVEAAPTEWSEDRLEELERRGIDPSAADLQMRSIVETHLFWDLDGDGVAEDLKIWIHPETGEILRVEYNDLGIRDLVRIPYINLPGQLYAIGAGWICEPMQLEMDALHNMRLDAEHIHSLQMFATKRGSKLSGKMEFRPLKRFEFDNPNDDFRVIQFPGIGPQSLQAELLTREYANRATGASDYMLGFENKAIGTRSTFAGTQFLAAQGNRLFDAIAQNVEEAMAEIGQIIAFQMIRNREASELSILPLLSPGDQEVFRDFLEVQVEDIPDLFSFRVKPTDSEKTEQVKTEQKMALFNLYSGYGEKMFQLAHILFNPQAQMPPPVKEVGLRFFTGATKLMEKIFVHFDEHHTDDYMPYVDDIDLILDQIRQMKEAEVLNVRTSRGGRGDAGGGGGALGGPGEGSGMEGAGEPGAEGGAGGGFPGPAM